ncbi:GumC family protein [Flagellimonas nanhaiensis]|uniref:non-specific protein-tyrosine kinase n=1 Tax=Flagellimonas nanhaiensis TaxID=2292706 RepID=A0A371JW63_9FLAO|nr:polysaccharide biosynthesis tyrosine autokinase [Allomuricauda nanhaiensis]RDY61972.1 tyrosine protein kinase [Allomuricauda nanhaiensis]
MEFGGNEIDIKSILDKYLKHWKWFAFSTILTLLGAFFYLRYAIPEYEASAKIQIIKDKSASSELSVFKDLDILSGAVTNTEIIDEIEILNARSNYKSIVKKLKLNLRYFVIGNIRNTEIYGSDYPFSINFLGADSVTNKSQHEFFLKILSSTEFSYSEKEDDTFKKYSFGSNINTKIGDIILVPESKLVSFYKDKLIKVTVDPIPSVVESYRAKTKISLAGEFSNIITISLTDSEKQRAIDVINELIQINNDNAVKDKKAIADKTSEFIENRISEIYNNLSSVDETAENFKSSRGIADLGSQSNVNFSQSAASERQLQDANIQLSIASSMKELIDGQEGYDIIPEVGLADQGISGSAQRYNELVAQRNRLLESSNEKNPVIVKLDQQLEGLKKGIQSSLNNVSNNLNLQVNSLSKQLSQINSRIYAAPGNERALRDISRRQQTTESLYLYLLQKREESQIAFASASPKSRIINSGYSADIPVSPRKGIIFLTAMMVGMLVPFSMIYVTDLLDNKIHNKLDLEKIVGDVPVLAEIPKIGKKEEKLIKNEDRSVLAESLRILRTNLDYIFRTKKKNGKGNLIFVTSSVPGEGKTLISSNLAMTFSSTGKRVLLIGADIRNPKLYTFFADSKNVDAMSKPKRVVKVGLTEYLSDQTLEIEDIINPMLVHTNTIDVIYSGKIPPNPAELLMSDRIGELFESLAERYDYVVVDTAPLMVVTDTLLISRYANQILYVTKADVTEKKVLQYPLKLKKEGKLKGLSFIVNNVKASNLGYGGKYGYGYGKSLKKWWSFS